MSPDTVLGWDLGGAHLKAVLVGAGGVAVAAVEIPCPLWKGIAQLGLAVDAVLTRLPWAPSLHAVTMTGELADCFPDRATGVAAIASALATRVAPERTRFFAGPRGFVGFSAVAGAAPQIASANWLALARFLARLLDAGLLVDIGSTTADLVPFFAGEVRANGYDDFGRLAADELVYTGVVRTPLMALAERAPIEGRSVGVIAEHFASTADVYRITGELGADADLHPSADGEPKSVEASVRRIARMVGRDAASAPLETWRSLAGFFAERQLARLLAAATRVLAQGEVPTDAPIVGAGVGVFLARRLAARLDRAYVDFASQVALDGAPADAVMTCAPAFAVARLLHMSQAGGPS